MVLEGMPVIMTLTETLLNVTLKMPGLLLGYTISYNLIFLLIVTLATEADYQYTLSHLLTQHNKLGGEPGAFVEQKIIPELWNG